MNSINSSIDDKSKAKKFTLDAKIYVRSISDALKCTRQISELHCNRGLYLDKASILNKTLQENTLLLVKYCHHDICNPNIIASTSFKSYYTYFMMKFCVNLYLNFHDRLNKINDYYELSKELDHINIHLKNDLQSYVTNTKRNNLILEDDIEEAVQYSD